MSDRAEARPFRGGHKVMTGALLVGVLGAALTALGFVTAPGTAWFSYLIALVFMVSLAFGVMGFLIIVHCMNATWPTVVRRLAESAAAVLPLLGVLFVPVLLGLRHLYPWMNVAGIGEARVRHLLEHKHPYLNAPFFVVRTAGYFVLWSAVAWLLRRWSLRSDRPGAPEQRGRLRALAAGAAPPLALTVTAAVTDWVMSLDPEWISYIFGFYFMSLSLLGGVAVLILMTTAARARGLLPSLNGSHLYALGRCLFAFLVLWAYTAFFQFFLIWMANKPVEARWFVDRATGGFREVSWFIVYGHFGLPFLALLSYDLKWRPKLLALLAWWLVAAQYLEVHWLIAPQRGGHPFRWLDLAALMGVGGLTVAFGLWLQRGHPLAPIGDPRLARATRYDSR
jgi:hypothetical protein